MPNTHQPSYAAHLAVPFDASFLPLAMGFAEQGARGFGYGDRETAGLVLAVEELFAFYTRRAAKGSTARLELEDQGFRLRLCLSFHVAEPDLSAFNLTFRVHHDSEASLEMLGPMIAARSVSSLRLEFDREDRVSLWLTRDRDYPPAPSVALPPTGLSDPLRVQRRPSREDVAHFAAMLAASKEPYAPAFLHRPGMAADMLAGGHLQAALLLSGNWIAGGIVWRPLTETCLELYGPYLFDARREPALSMLLDEAVSRISRSGARGLLRRQGPLPDAERFFDRLGELTLGAAGEKTPPCTYYYRQLREESGGVVYASGPLAAFLQRQYDRLCLPRQVREHSGGSARLRDASVLAVELEHARALAVIHPLCSGTDMAANLVAHLDLLRAEGIADFIVEVNTGRGEETAFAEALEAAGFAPRLLIPDAGQGDLVIYAYGRAHDPGEAA